MTREEGRAKEMANDRILPLAKYLIQFSYDICLFLKEWDLWHILAQSMIWRRRRPLDKEKGITFQKKKTTFLSHPLKLSWWINTDSLALRSRERTISKQVSSLFTRLDNLGPPPPQEPLPNRWKPRRTAMTVVAIVRLTFITTCVRHTVLNFFIISTKVN